MHDLLFLSILSLFFTGKNFIIIKSNFFRIFYFSNTNQKYSILEIFKHEEKLFSTSIQTFQFAQSFNSITAKCTKKTPRIRYDIDYKIYSLFFKNIAIKKSVKQTINWRSIHKRITRLNSLSLNVAKTSSIKGSRKTRTDWSIIKIF